MKKTWWKEGIVYQIYPRSFKDSSGNGIGDIYGIIEKLDYIKSLGINMIWICPMYSSPNEDNGYDISDYRKISEEFGGNKAFDILLKEMHKRDLKLIMDLVSNHSSDEHKWFEESKKGEDNPYHDYYFWKKGKSNKPPNNWLSVFSGSAWQWDSNLNKYYLHLFTKKQPDLNWENPRVRDEIYDVLNFWLSKGVDGFRMDVISFVSKRLDFPSAKKGTSLPQMMGNIYANGPRIHEFLKEMNKKVLSKYDVVTVGEGPGVNLKTGLKYVDENEQELNMVFHFDHLQIDYGPEGKFDPLPIDFIKFKKVFSDWDLYLKNKGWNSIFLGNHDFSRIVSRFGNDQKHRNESAKLLATLLMTLRGTPYVYQGDEIGMTNVKYPSIDYYDDVETRNAWKEAEEQNKDMDIFLKAVHKQSRDNARTPLQWDNSRNAGFSSSKPWLDVNKNYNTINVELQQDNPDSILNYYREIIRIRKNNSTLIYGDFLDLEPNNEKLFIYKRWDKQKTFIIVLNFSDDKILCDLNDLSSMILVIGNYKKSAYGESMDPWEARVYSH
ncbi:glucohydrolase [Bacteroidetes bacterium SCGC AAA795-G10]|nr:glucohydrolase [Bacteroidetes bacterium SCGC AAA795-G10]